MNWKKILHFIFGHKEELTDTIEIEGGELRLYLCACGKQSYAFIYRLEHLAKNNDISGEALKAMRETGALLTLFPDVPFRAVEGLVDPPARVIDLPDFKWKRSK